MSRVFIAYRRADSAAWAAQLNRRIGLRFGRDLVFQDVDDIRPGDDFMATLRRELATCEVYLVLIGPQWLVDAAGRRRLDDPEDVLRREVVEALASAGTVIPVLVGGAAMPAEHDLPEPMRTLHLRQAAVLADAQWNRDMAALLERLRELILPRAADLSLADARNEVYAQQQRYFEKLDRSNADALELAQRTQGWLDRVLPLYPQDPYLKTTRGYLHKNEAMALLRLGRSDEAGAALDKGETVFRTMLEERPDDAGALNGLGSVEAVRGNLELAHDYVDRALAIEPGYEEALEDHRTLLRALGLQRCPRLGSTDASPRRR